MTNNIYAAISHFYYSAQSQVDVDAVAENMVDLFSTSTEWGMAAGTKYLGYLASLAVVIYLFKN